MAKLSLSVYYTFCLIVGIYAADNVTFTVDNNNATEIAAQNNQTVTAQNNQTTEVVTELGNSSSNSQCVKSGIEDIKITIFSRRNSTGQFFAHVKVEEGSEENNSWQVAIDHDSSCGSADRGIDNKLLQEIGYKPKPPGPGYELLPGYGFYKFHEKKDWYHAKLTCQDEGAHLVVVNSQTELDFILGLASRSLGRADEDIYMGLTDMEKEGYWTSVLGEPFAELGYGVWAQWEPTGGTSENCAYVYMKNAKYYSNECKVPETFVCEHPF